MIASSSCCHRRRRRRLFCLSSPSSPSFFLCVTSCLLLLHLVPASQTRWLLVVQLPLVELLPNADVFQNSPKLRL